MKGKFVMMALLCALLVGLVPPGSARADVEYYVPIEYSRDYVVILYNSNWGYRMFVSDEPFYVGSSSSGCFNSYTDNGIIHLEGGRNLTDGCWVVKETINDTYTGYNKSGYRASNHNIYNGKPDAVGELFQAQNIVTSSGYSFPLWCLDAGLSYQASSYENDIVLPYVYNDYVHIVRRTGTDKYGRWVLTTIGNSIIGDNLSDYTLMVDDAGKLQVYALYSGEEEQGYQLFVRNYIYDTDGWKMISFELFDTREDDDFIIELGEDSAINDANLLAYTSVDICDEGLSLKHSASTEYYDVNDILPDVPEQPEEPSVTPTVPPSGGSGGTGLTLYRPEMSGKIVSSFASMFDVPNGADEDIVLDLLQGMNVTVHGWLSDASGKVWYYCTYKNVYEDKVSLFTGYMDSANVGLTNGADVEDGEDMTLRDKIMEITAFVGSVPLIIGALFSFLPPWCLTLTGIGFAIIAIIMIRRGTLG